MTHSLTPPTTRGPAPADLNAVGSAATSAALTVDRLGVSFGHCARRSAALVDVSFDVATGEVMGVVGESGSGKSTLAKVLVGLYRPSQGRVAVLGRDVTTLSRAQRRAHQRVVQMIPQDPKSSLNPRRTVGQTLAEALDPVRPQFARRHAEIQEWLHRVKLPAGTEHRYPHELSGGQRQRVAIARGLMVQPDVLIADEITSALDVVTQAEILSLLDELRASLGFTLVFISHNLAVVRAVCDRVVVLQLGELVESGPGAEVLAHPTHPYTRALVDSVPGSPGFTLEREG